MTIAIQIGARVLMLAQVKFTIVKLTHEQYDLRVPTRGRNADEGQTEVMTSIRPLAM